MRQFLTVDSDLPRARLRHWVGRFSQPLEGAETDHGDVVELAWVESGTVRYRFDGRELVLGGGQGLLLPRAMPHATALKGKVVGTGLWIDAALIADALGDLDLDVLTEPILFEDARSLALLGRLLRSEVALYGGTEKRLLVSLLDALIAKALGPAQDGVRHGTKVDLLREAIEVMRKRYDEPCTVEQLADQVGISRFKFHRYFRDVAGCSPYQFLLRTRLTRAHDALRDGRSVTRAAFDAGFNDLSRFCRMFRRRYGMAPSVYRGQQSYA